MKTRAALAVAIAAAAIFAAGCGNGSMNPYILHYGDVEGYIYADSYNSGIAARPALRAAGRAVPDGQVPVAGAQVSLTAKGFIPAQPPLPVQTDGDGKFVFSDVETGAYTLKAVKDGMADIEFDVTVVADAINVVNDAAGDDQMSMTPTDKGTLTVTAVADCQVSIPVEGDIYVGGLLTTYKTPVAVINDIAPGLR
ncbi:MAG TPA: carboxypeptidase-like regulatory domain-containing protein, partial [bacterium]|nr:carboxypeptidase-like regulatory domain-containing protein [bacterium]